MIDRCDTAPHWFFFTSDDRPYLGAVVRSENNAWAKDQQHRASRRGGYLEVRSGNYAAATITQLMTCWPEPRIEVADDGSYVYVEPCDVQYDEERELEAA